MQLFAFGSNGSGQLGIGHEEDVSVPTQCLFEDADTPDRAVGTHSISSSRSPAALSATSAEPCSARIVAGGNHTLVHLANGAVYAAGWNGDGRCGQTPCGESHAEVRFLRFMRIRVALDRDESDECGTRLEGERVLFDRFRHVAATWEGSFLVAEHERERDHEDGLWSAHAGLEQVVFVMGSGAKGELGLGSIQTRVTRAACLPGFPPKGTRIVCIASGMRHTVAVLSSGDVYGWGGARKGQLGEVLKQHTNIVWNPMKIEDILFKAKEAVCGREFTVVIGNKDRGEYVILGAAGDKWRVVNDAPSSDLLRGYLSVAASWHGIYVHLQDSCVLAWGRNDRGQLPQPDFPTSRKIAVGSEHALAILNDGTVAAFGWGEHGNCGAETDAKGNVAGRYNRIPLMLKDGSNVLDIGAGCATSWIFTS